MIGSMNTEIKERQHSQNCLVFVTHKITEDIRKYLSFLKKETEGLIDLLVLYDNSSQPICEEDYPDLMFYFFDSVHLKGFFHQENRLLPNTLVALMECSKQYEYEHYLLMENDIILNGDFRGFIGKINGEAEVDYIHIAYDVEGSPKNHWPVKYIQNSPFGHLYFSWCQLLYISRKLMLEVCKFMQNNDTFHYEFLLPTMAYNDGFVVRQFENYGYQFQLSWGPAELYEYKYKYERMENTFYHPIKDLSIVDFE